MPENSRLNQAPDTKPVAQPTSLWSRLVERMGLRSPSIREDIADALSQPTPNADLSAVEQTMLRNVLALREHRVADVMVPRADIIAVAAETSLGDLLSVFRTANHSRLPVYGETLDDPRGMIHIRDFLDFLASRSKTGGRRRASKTQVSALDHVDLSTPISSAKILRPVLYVPPSMPAIDLLVRMQATRTHMALVIDEYGGTDGLISIEDLVEIIVGEIDDEHDQDEAPMITKAADGRMIADARISLDELSTALGFDLSQSELAEEVDTLGGLITTLAGRVPVRGALVPGPDGLEFEVIDADPRRVKRVRIYRPGSAVASDASADPAKTEAPPLSGEAS